jgi:glycine dehydrogenase subunit 1
MARAGRNGRVLVSAGVETRFVEALRAYGRGSGYEPEVFPLDAAPDVNDDVAAVVAQFPDRYGALRPVGGLFETAHAAGGRAIHVFDPLSLGVLASPAELGADIAVAEGQSLGNHLSFGGPYLGVLAARMEDVRRMPGRIVGETVDAEGRTGYVLTLQAREQHIRREKANSNICTNQTLMAIAATIYLGWLGSDGLTELGRQCSSRAAYAAERLCAVAGVELLFPGVPFFKEFALRLPTPASLVRDALVEHGILAGVPLPDADGRALLVAVTEKRSRNEIDRYAAALAGVLA